MSKNLPPVLPEDNGDSYCFYQVLTPDVSELEGKLLTHIDATFSDVQQRKAQKDIIRQMVWDWILPKRTEGKYVSKK